MEGRAQRVLQASTKLQQAMEIARSVGRASMGLVQDKPVKHPARAATRVSTGLLQEEPLKDRARHVPRTPTRLLIAVLVPPALATVAIQDPMEGTALSVRQESTRHQTHQVTAATVYPAHTPNHQDLSFVPTVGQGHILQQ